MCGLRCQKQASQARISNYIPQNNMGCKYLSLSAVNCLWYQSLLISSSLSNVTFKHQVNNKVFYISEVCIFVQFYPVIDIIFFETSFACGDIHISFCSSGQLLCFYILFIWYYFPGENVPVSFISVHYALFGSSRQYSICIGNISHVVYIIPTEHICWL